MPSYVIHLACARRVLQLHPYADEYENNLYCLGNLAADMCQEKRGTHFWDDATYLLLVRKPNLQAFQKKYLVYMQEPFVAGYYAHLLLDTLFLERYWDKHFRFYNEACLPETQYDKVRYVEVVEQQVRYERTDFFSLNGYYGDYDKLNGYFARNYKLEFPKLDFLQDELEAIRRIEELDVAYACTKLKETKKWLEQSLTCETEAPRTLKIFQVDELEYLVEETAKKLANSC